MMKRNMRFKAVLTVLLAMLSLGAGAPQAVGTVATADPVAQCCCTGVPGCGCQKDKPCGTACTRAPVQTSDQQIPARAAQPSFTTGYVVLFTIAPASLSNFASNLSSRRSGSHASLSFSESLPQAMLCLWQI
jgi:hypothetical protein